MTQSGNRITGQPVQPSGQPGFKMQSVYYILNDIGNIWYAFTFTIIATYLRCFIDLGNIYHRVITLYGISCCYVVGPRHLFLISVFVYASLFFFVLLSCHVWQVKKLVINYLFKELHRVTFQWAYKAFLDFSQKYTFTQKNIKLSTPCWTRASNLVNYKKLFFYIPFYIILICSNIIS